MERLLLNAPLKECFHRFLAIGTSRGFLQFFYYINIHQCQNWRTLLSTAPGCSGSEMDLDDLNTQMEKETPAL